MLPLRGTHLTCSAFAEGKCKHVSVMALLDMTISEWHYSRLWPANTSQVASQELADMLSPLPQLHPRGSS